MTFIIRAFSITIRKCRIMLRVMIVTVMSSIVMLSMNFAEYHIVLSCHSECHNTSCHYAECRTVKCQYSILMVY